MIGEVFELFGRERNTGCVETPTGQDITKARYNEAAAVPKNAMGISPWTSGVQYSIGFVDVVLDQGI